MANQYNTFAGLANVADTDYAGIVARLDTIFKAATPQQLLDGLAWYADRHSFLQGVAELSGVAIETLAYVCSALSPQTRWAKNERALLDHVGAYCSGQGCPRTATLYGANDTKAWRILTTGDVSHIGKGAKTLAFAENLQEKAYTGHTPIVTIDTVYHQAATGVVPQGISKKVYALLTRATCQLAARYDILPYQFQAVCWVVYRNGAL